MMFKLSLVKALLFLLMVVVVLGLNPVMAQPELEGEKITTPIVTKVTDETKQLKDPNTRATLQKQGIDPDYVELIADYGEAVGPKPGNAYSQTYNDRITGLNVVVTSQLPAIDAFGNTVKAGWIQNGNTYISDENLFTCTVAGLRTTVMAESNQPNGIKSGQAMAFEPTLSVGGVGVAPLSATPELLATDPVNGTQTLNTLEWDYGICKRQLRLIEGSILGSWLFDQVPKGDVLIQYNQVGSFNLRLGPYELSPDEEYITVEDFQKELALHGLPIIIGDSLTFYPDANPETTSVDGQTQSQSRAYGWSALIASDGNGSDDSCTNGSIQIGGHQTPSVYSSLWRPIFLFDTSAIPDDATIESAVLSLYGNSKGNHVSMAATFNLFAVDPSSNTALIDSDFTRANWTPGVPLATEITYDNYDVSGYNDFTLNAEGIEAIDKTGVSKFGGMEAAFDATGIKPPELDGVQAMWMAFYYSEYGEGYKPKLVVVCAAGEATVTTGAATNITSSGFTGHGTITDIGTGTPTQRGVCWATSGTPTTADDTDYETGTFGIGAFSRSVTGLDSGTVYHYRAYAVNVSGTGYGATELFCTVPVLGDFPTTVLDLEYEPDQISGTPSYTIEDQSGNDNDATYSLGANPGDLDISLGTLQAACPAEYDADDSGPGSWVFVGTPPAEPDDFYMDSELFDQLPGAEAINTLLEESDIPLSLFWFTMIYALIIVVGFAIYAKTKHQFGLVVAAWMVIFFSGGMGMLDWWLVAICVIYGIGMLIAERDYQFV